MNLKNSGVKKTFFSAIVISIGIFVSKITGLLRDILFAKYLGSGIVAEAFYVAFRLPNTFRRIFAEGAFSNAFVPFFSSKVNKNKKIANYFSFKVLCFLCISLLLITLIMEIFMPTIIRFINPGFIDNEEKFNLSVELARISFPYIILISVASFFGSILNSIGRFWQFAFVSVILNIALIFGLVSVNNLFLNSGFCLSWMLIIGGVFQIIFIFYFCIKYSVVPNSSIKNINKKDVLENNKDVKVFIKKLFPAIISSSLLQINIFIDGIFASYFDGANSYFYYTTRIVYFPLSIIGYSLSTAILPSLSVAFHEKKQKDIENLQTQSINVAMFFSIPATLFIFTSAYQIIRFIYERGEFLSNDTLIVSNMLKMFILSVPFTILMKIFYSCFYSKKNTKIPLYICLISLIFNIISNCILIKIVGMNCIIISTTLSSILSCILSLFFLKKENIFYVKIKKLSMTLKVLFISIISCLVLPILLDKINFFIMIFICVVVHFILCFVLKIITKDFIKSILKK